MSISARRRIWREKLDEGLDLADVEILCHDFNLDFDNLEGNIKKTKIASFLEALEERKLLEQLQAYLVDSDEYNHIVLPGSSAMLPDSPYRGLFAFQEVHADNFFGRDLFIDQVIRGLSTQPLVPIVGPSGSGKSSLIFAGVFPRIRHNPDWLLTYFRPGNEPLRNLVGVLVSLLEPEMSTVDRRIEINKVEDGLRDKQLTLAELVNDLLAKDPTVSNLLLYVDQFEELFTHNPEKEERELFLTQLLSLLPTAENDTRVKILYTMRADFLGDALSHNILADVLNAEEIDDIKLRPMNRREMAQVIMSPALNAGTTFEEGLVDRILDDVGNEPGNLPLLQFVLDEMWSMQENFAMTHLSYQLLGEVTGALALYADTVYESLTVAEQALAPRIFTQLVQPGRGSADTRRLVLKDELDRSMWPLIIKLTDARLLVTSRDGLGNETIELSHEALIGTWTILTQWMSADRSFREWQEQMRSNMRQWEHGGRDKDLLLRGAALEEADKWLRNRRKDMTVRDMEYIRLGQEEARVLEWQRRRRLVFAFSAAGLIGLLGLFSLSLQGTLRSEVTARATSEANALAAATAAVEARNTAEAERQVSAGRLDELISAQATTDQALALSQQRGAEAVSAQQTSEADRAFAVEARQTADASALEAEVARGTAVADRDAANQARLEAEAAQVAADTARQEAEDARIESEIQKKIAESQAFAAEARIERSIDPMGSLLLAVEAGKAGDSVQAFNALNLTLPLIAPLPQQSFETFSIGSQPAWIDQSNRDTFILQDDGAVTLIDAASGEIEQTYSIELGGESLAQFSKIYLSPDQRLLFGSYQRSFVVEGFNAAVVWDAVTGEIIFLEESPYPIIDGQWDASGRYFLFWDIAGLIQIYDRESDSLITLGQDANIRGADWAVNRNQLLTWHAEGRSGRAVLWDFSTAEPLFEIRSEAQGLLDVHFSPDGGRLLLQLSNGIEIVELTEDADVQRVVRIELDRPADGVAWHPDGSQFISWGDQNLLEVWNAADGSLAFVLAHFDEINGSRWNQAGDKILSWSRDNTARVWDARTGLQLSSFEHFDMLTGAVWSQSEQEILTWSDDGTARIWDAASGDQTRVFSHPSGVEYATYSPDEERILTVDGDGRVQVFANRLVYPPLDQAVDGRIRGGVWSRTENEIAVWGRDGSLRLIDVSSGSLVETLDHHPIQNSDVVGAVYAENGQLLSWSNDNSVNIWEAGVSSPIVTLEFDGDALGAAWNRAETLVLAWSEDETIKVWDPETDEIVAELIHSSVSGARWNGDESQILSWGTDGSIFIWQIGSSQPRLQIETGGKVFGATWNNEEDLLISWGEGAPSGISFWDVATGRLRYTLPHERAVRGVDLSQDNERLISWGVDEKVRVWEIRSGTNAEVVLQLEHDSFVPGAAWTNGEDRVLSWSWDRTARLWDSRTGRLVVSVTETDDWILNAALNVSEDQLMITTFDSEVRVYNTEINELVDLGCQVATRNFTWDEWRRYQSGEPYEKTCRNLPVDCSVPEVSWPFSFTPEIALCTN